MFGKFHSCFSFLKHSSRSVFFVVGIALLFVPFHKAEGVLYGSIITLSSMFTAAYVAPRIAAGIVRKKYPLFSEWKRVIIYFTVALFVIDGWGPLMNILVGKGEWPDIAHMLYIILSVFWTHHFLKAPVNGVAPHTQAS